MSEIRDELVSLIAAECVNMNEVQTLIKGLFKKTIESMLGPDGDKNNWIDVNDAGTKNKGTGWVKSISQKAVAGPASGISRSQSGEPFSRTGGKYRTGNVEDKIIAMYAKGMSDREIGECLSDIYGINAPVGLIGKVTDKIIPDAYLWQNRPLGRIYPVVFPDRMYININKDETVVRKCIGFLLGIGMDGRKDILGIWITENDNASFWTEVLNNIKSRGVKDILITCHDGMPGFTTAIELVFPKTEQQLCMIHKVREVIKYIPGRDIKEVLADLKLVWGSSSLREAELWFEKFRTKWGSRYPQIINLWDVNRNELTTCFKYPREIRRLIYTVNTAEGFHRMLRKFTKVVYSSDDAVIKSVYLSIREIARKWEEPLKDWETITGQLVKLFNDRLAA